MKSYHLFTLALFVFVFSQTRLVGQCTNCFEGPTTVFAGQTAYYYWGGTPGGVWYVTNATPGVIGTPTQSSEILSIPILGQGGFSITHDNAFGTQVNVIAWNVPGPPDDPYIETLQCGRVTISMRTQYKPADVDWYWIDGYGNFVSISPSIDVYANGTYYVQSRSHDHPEVIGGTSRPVEVTMPPRPVDAVIMANNSSGPITVCAGETFMIGSAGGVGSPHYWASSNGMASWDVFADRHSGENSFAFSTLTAGTYIFHVRNKTDVCGFCWDAGNSCTAGSTVTVIVLPAANSGELFLNKADRNVCAGTRIPVSLINNVGTAYYNIYYKKDLNHDGTPDIVSVEDAANLGTSFEYTLTEDGEWYFEYWSQTCGQNSQRMISTISVWAPPSGPQFAGPDPLVCAGDSTRIHVLPGDPGITMRWYNSPDAVTPLNSFPYTAELSTGPLYQSTSFWVASYRSFSATTGCEGTRYQYFVTVSERPKNSDLVASSTSICVGESVRISALGGTGTTHFYCSSDGGLSWNVIDDGYVGAMQFEHAPPVPGTYLYKVRNNTACGFCDDPGNTCKDGESVTVVVNSRPTAGNIVGQRNVLFGQPYSYSVPDASFNISDYNWQVTGGSIVAGQGTPRVKANFRKAGGEISLAVANGQCPALSVPSLIVAEGGNYSTEEVMLVNGISDSNIIASLDEHSKTRNTIFYDGLGRQIQSVSWRSSPQRRDVVIPVVYDAYGREPVKYLPFTANNDGYYKSDPVGSSELQYAHSPQHDFYDGRTFGVAIDNSPNIKTIFESSPLGRVMKQGAAGVAWQPDSIGRDDRTIEKKYLLNGPNEVCQFTFSSSMGIALWPGGSDAYYQANELLSNKSIDEHNNETIEFIDKLGRTISKHLQIDVLAGLKQYACTYYVYDDFSNLTVVLPPEAVKQIVGRASLFAKGGRAAMTTLASIIDSYCFRYKYDSKRRMTHKKVPGADWVFMVYDDRDRQVLMQDGNQRVGTTNYWTFTKYDQLNRPILMGVRDTLALSQEAMQAVVNDHYTRNSSCWYENYIGNAPGNVHGYSNKAYPVMTSATASDMNVNNYLTVTYYDNYVFRQSWPSGYDYVNEELSAVANARTYAQREHAFEWVEGQITGTMTKVLDGGITGGYTWLKSVNYYDDKYRIIQTITDNYKGGTDRVSYLADFMGKVMTSKALHIVSDPTWKDQVGVTLVGNKLFNSATQADQWGNSGAASIQQLQPGQDGWVEFITTEPSTSRVIGLSAVNADANYTSIDYAFHQSNGDLLIVERGVVKKTLGPYVPGEVLRIERSGSEIKYLRDGISVETSGIPSAGNLLIDVAFFSNGATLAGVRSSFSTTSNVVIRRFEYDHAGRLLVIHHKLDSNPEFIIARNEYNELGQLIDKSLHSIEGKSHFAQSVDFRYNIRGWLESINNARLRNDNGATNDENNDLFGLELGYENSIGTGNAPLYNGNIGGMKWSTNSGLSAVKDVAYNYKYDPLGRIMGADFIKDNKGVWTNSRKAFNEGGYDYDLNGNIIGLWRNGPSGENLDVLRFDYGTSGGNQLLKVSDTGDKSRGFVEPLLTSGNDYAYDANGNMTRDKNKGITAITYNLFNLPYVVSKGGSKVYYSYDATGHKLSQSLVAGKQRKSTDYSGDFIYENDSLRFVNHEEGRVVMTDRLVVSQQLLGFSECNNAAAFKVYGNLSMTISNFTSVVGETYVKLVSNVNSNSTPGMISDLVNVKPRQRYQLRVRGYCASANAFLYVQSETGSAIVWSGDAVPAVEEGWVSREFVVPAGVSNIRLGIRFNRVTKGNAVYLNTIQLYEYDAKNGAMETKSIVEYQYHLKDHLDNVRMTFTTLPDIQTEKATLESEVRVEERGEFLRYDNARRVLSSLLDHTNGKIAGWSQRLNGTTNEKYGLARSVAVMPGDTVRIEVYGKYIDPDPANRTKALTSLLNLINLGTTSVVRDGSSYASSGSSFLFGDLIQHDESPGPKAYLNWLIFDGRDSLIDYGYSRMSSFAREYGQDAGHERLSSPDLLIREPGHVYTWYSNEEMNALEVYFDDFTVTHVKGPVIQQQDYYPFGLTFNSFSRENSASQEFKYNGKEEQDELGLNWLDFGRRMYDPLLGRFLGVDPLADKYNWLTTYNYAENSPIANIDLWGLQRYYAADGSLLGQVGENMDVRVVNSSMTNAQASAHIQSGTAAGLEALTNGSVAFADYFQTVADVTNDAALRTYSQFGNCYTAAAAQLSDEGVTEMGRDHAIQTVVDNSAAVNNKSNNDATLVADPVGGAIRIQSELNEGNPVLVGVKEVKDSTVPNPNNRNALTGHFVVIRSATVDANGVVSFNYLDNAKASTGKSSENNNFILDTSTGIMTDNTTPGGRTSYSSYTITEVRKNQ